MKDELYSIWRDQCQAGNIGKDFFHNMGSETWFPFVSLGRRAFSIAAPDEALQIRMQRRKQSQFVCACVRALQVSSARHCDCD